MSSIEHILGRQILDSRGNPTVEVEVLLDSGALGRAAVPSRRVDRAVRGGRAARRREPRSAARACATPSPTSNGEIRDAVTGFDALDQRVLDQTLIDLDGTDNKSSLGANAILGVSLAAAKAAADELDLPLYRYVGGPNAHVLPVPMMNVLNGGAHADNNVDFQEFMVDAGRRRQLLRGAALGRRDLPHPQASCSTSGACPRRSATRAASRRTCRSNEEAVQLLIEAIERAGFAPGDDIAHRARPGLIGVLPRRRLRARRRGPHAAQPRAGRLLGGSVRPVPDRVDRGRHGRGGLGRLGRAHRTRSASACSSWATTCSSRTSSGCAAASTPASPTPSSSRSTRSASLTETLDTVALATRSGYTAVMSHRSGETEDVTIADLAVATNCGQIKTGAPARSDRVAKYNQLLRIEEDLGEGAAFLGRSALSRGGAAP